MAKNIDFDPVLLRKAAETVLDEFALKPKTPMTNQEHMEAILAPVLAEAWSYGESAEAIYQGGSFKQHNPYLEEV